MPSLKEWWATIKSKYLNEVSIKQIDIVNFFQQFSTLMTAGVPLLASLEILAKNQEKKKLQLLIFAIKKNVMAGTSLSKSIGIYPFYFSHLICQMIKIGEITGKLDHMLAMITFHLEKNRLIQLRIQKALFYPLTVFLTAILITICLFLFVIPQFADLFQHSINELPLLTRGIFFISYFCQQYIFYMIILLLCISFAFFYGKRHHLHLKNYYQALLLHLPIVQPLLKKICLARFVRHFGLTFSAGIALIDGLQLAVKLEKNKNFKQILKTVNGRLRDGYPLHLALQTCNYFPFLMIQMIKVGEETGKLDHMLFKLADIFETDLDQALHHVHKLIEPLIMIIVGALIGGLIVGIYLPIFKLGTLV